MNTWLVLALAIGIASTSLFTPAFAQSCVETGTCPLSSNIFDYFATPFTLLLGDWVPVLFWGIVIAIIHLRAQNPMMTGIVGTLIASFFLGTSTMVVASQAFYIGGIMMAASIGFVIYSLYKSRLMTG